MTTIVWRDGKPLAEVEDDNAAFAWLLRHQGQSVDWAMKYEGYSIGPQSSYGCGDESCLSCYPFIRQCEHGVPYDPIIPNGDEIPECDHDICAKCEQPIVIEGDMLVCAISGDDGGTYDRCEEGGRHVVSVDH